MLATFETFRDPAGSLRIDGDRVLRLVRADYSADSVAFLESDLAREWVSEGRLISTEILEQQESTGDLLLEHPRIFFPIVPLGVDALSLDSGCGVDAGYRRSTAR